MRTWNHLLKLLLVEDEAVLRGGLARVMRTRGFDVQTAASTPAAEVLLRRERFDAVLTDFGLGPDGDGVDVLKLTQRLYPGALRLLMTGDPLRPRIHEIVGRVIDHTYRKPLELRVLTDVLNNHRRALQAATA